MKAQGVSALVLPLLLCVHAHRAALFTVDGLLLDPDGAEARQEPSDASPQATSARAQRSKQALAWLLAPINVDTFLMHRWEQSHQAVQRQDRRYYRRLLSVDAVDAGMLFRQQRGGKHKIDFPALKDSDKANTVSEKYKTGWEGYVDGGTLTLEHFEKDHQQLASLCRRLQGLFYYVRANLYLSGPATTTFLPHADGGDILVVQVSGRKTWTLYPDAVTPQWPLFQHLRYGALRERSQLGEGVTVALEQGDVLYVPRGLAHEVSTLGDSSSIHFTLSISTGSVNWAEVLKNQLTQFQKDSPFWDHLFNATSKAPHLRRGLPPGTFWEAPGSEKMQEVEELWRQKVDVFAKETFGEVIRMVQSNMITYDKEKETIISAFKRARIDGLTTQSRVHRVRAIQVTNGTTGSLVVGTPESSWRVCARLSELVWWIMNQKLQSSFEVGGLPGVDEFGKVAIVRMMIQSGALQLVTS